MPSPDDFRLQQGTVIDHLPVGTAPVALSILGLPRDGPVTVGMNVPSRRIGRKDIIRVEGFELRKAEIDRLALLGPQVTVSIVKDGKVFRKMLLEVPERLVGVLRCQNPTCVTNSETLASVFERESADPLVLRCHYCERRASDPRPFVPSRS
jgi:aspartate carbamoyltransferase regulatory subunit